MSTLERSALDTVPEVNVEEVGSRSSKDVESSPVDDLDPDHLAPVGETNLANFAPRPLQGIRKADSNGQDGASDPETSQTRSVHYQEDPGSRSGRRRSSSRPGSRSRSRTRSDAASNESVPPVPEIPFQNDPTSISSNLPSNLPDWDLLVDTDKPTSLPISASQVAPFAIQSKSSARTHAYGSGSESASSIASSRGLPLDSGTEATPASSHTSLSIRRDIEYSVSRLMTREVFEDLVFDTSGKHKFREFLVSEAKGREVQFDFLCDQGEVVRMVRTAASGVEAVYFSPNSGTQVKLPAELLKNTTKAFSKMSTLTDDMSKTGAWLVQSFYEDEFRRFVKLKVVEQATVRLGKFNVGTEEAKGLGDCFCFTNPRLRDHPIVLVSDGFAAVTGYEREQIIGRNCRFLQGPETSPEAVQRIRNALNAGKDCTELLLNYRRTGEPFFCLLCIIPLFDAAGNLVYFIGGQTNVSGMCSSPNASFLIGGADFPATTPPDTRPNPLSPGALEFSPPMQEYITSTSPPGSIRSSSIRSAGSSSIHSQEEAGQATGMFGRLMGKVKQHTGPGTLTKAGNTRKELRAGKEGTLAIGAEAELGKDEQSLNSRLGEFKSVYSKVMIIRPKNHEIIFVTKELLAFFRLPCHTFEAQYNSPLLHKDLTSLLRGTETQDTNIVRARVKKTIKSGVPLSISCGIRIVTKTGLFSKSATPNSVTMLHLTPIKEKEGTPVAYIGVFA